MNLGEVQKILVADDDAINRQVLGELLKPEYTVLLAKNGEQALERVQRHAPDLILLDVMMPDIDGYEVLRRLRADPHTAQIAVVFISGLGRPEDEATGLKMGAADYITKPFNATVVLARVALHLQFARQRRMLEHLAHVDGLTELANRRKFDEVYAAEWQRARRAHQPLSLALLDIDCFKQYNDHYGHPAGDRALRAVARAVGSQLRRTSDLAARYGGEEFALLLPGLTAEQAQHLMANILAAIAGLAIQHERSVTAPHLTVSVGGATVSDFEHNTLETLYEAADAHLYQAKQAGRNRVVWQEA
jgi:diguanylate cyclase (GGDEF)-like protein